MIIRISVTLLAAFGVWCAWGQFDFAPLWFKILCVGTVAGVAWQNLKD